MSRQPFPGPQNNNYPRRYNQHWHSRYPPPNFQPPPSRGFYIASQPFSTPPPGYLDKPSAKPFVKNEDQMQRDQAWLNDWLQRRGTQTQETFNKTETCNNLKVREAKNLVVAASKCQQELVDLKCILETKANSDAETWSKLVSCVEEKKEQLSQIMSQLNEKETTVSLIRLLKKRAVKRKAEKRRREKRKSEKLALNSNRQVLHVKIDEWRAKKHEEVERAQREEDTMNEADAVLGEVRLKQAEGRRWLQMLTSLAKLRKYRAQAAADRGLKPTDEEDAHFNSISEKLMTMWKSQLEVYQKEEALLRVMLEEEAVARGDKNKSLSTSNHLIQWQHLLFGPTSNTSHVDYDYHTRAESSLQDLLHIREEWDHMVSSENVAMSTSIPIGWVIPVSPSSEDWASLLSTSKESNESIQERDASVNGLSWELSA